MIGRLLCALGLRRKTAASLDRYAGWTLEQKILEIVRALGDSVCLGRRRWLWIEKDGADIDLFLMSGQRAHDPLCGSGVVVTVRGDQFAHFGKTALSLWPVRDAAEQERIADRFRAAIDEALLMIPAEEVAA